MALPARISRAPGEITGKEECASTHFTVINFPEQTRLLANQYAVYACHARGGHFPVPLHAADQRKHEILIHVDFYGSPP
ncbi:MAG: hypothetical protein ACYC0F_15305 [Rhodanobacter sp.]